MDILNTIAMWVGYGALAAVALAIIGAVAAVIILGIYRHIP